jgi:radical SAM superfamily enzyme YgiQ (UPF0313 family)
MRIALFRPRPAYVDHILYGSRYALMAYDLFANRYPPLGLLQIAAALERAGHEVRVVDCEQMFLSPAAAARRVRSFEPEFLAVSSYIFNPAADLDFARRLKDLLGGPPLLLTGHFPRSYPEEALSHYHVDFALTGKGFLAVPALAAALGSKAQGLRPAALSTQHSALSTLLTNVPGIAFRRGGKVVKTAKEPFRLEGLPPPARHLVDNRFYTSGLAHRRRVTTILGSIGCPYRCYYCPEHRVPYHARPVGEIVDEMCEARGRFGIFEFCFLDPFFNASKARVMDFCSEILARGLDVSWTIKARADVGDREMLAAMRRAGCTRIGYGIESGDQGEVDRLGRRMDLAAAVKTLGLTRDAGIPTIAYFMVGNYDDTVETLRRTAALVETLPVDNILIATTTPLPGSALHAEIVAARGYDPWIAIARGRTIDPETLRPPRSALSAAELNRFAARMYRRFYRRPGFLARAFLSPGTHRLYAVRGIQNAALNAAAVGFGLAEQVRAALDSAGPWRGAARGDPR